MYFLRKQLKARIGQAGRENKKADQIVLWAHSPLHGRKDLVPYNALKMLENNKLTYDDIKLK